MRKSLWKAESRRELAERLARLKPDTTPRWGKMSAPQMLAHLVDWMLMAKGELPTAPWNRVMRYPPLKQILIYWMPFPKSVPTAPELIRREASDWSAEQTALRRCLDEYGNPAQLRTWPEHPAFGKLTPTAWGVFGYRHMDHHLRQFGL